MKMRNASVEEQIQWMLSYIQGELVDIWKENIIENLENGSLVFIIMGEFLTDLRQEFREGDDKIMKIAKLKKVEQKKRIIGEFVQEFRRIMRESSYKERSLIEEFKREINRVIQRKLMEVEYLSRSIEQWYKRVTNLDKHWRESRQEEERLRRRRKTRIWPRRQEMQ